MAKIRTWVDSDFSPAEKSAFHYAERLYVDHAHIDTELFEEMLEFYTEEQILEIGWAVVSYMGYGKLIHSFGLQPNQAP